MERRPNLNHINYKQQIVLNQYLQILQIQYKKDASKFLKIVTLEDLSGTIDITFFHQKLEHFNDLLVPEAKVTITGKVNHRNENEAGIMADEVKSVDNASIFAKERLKNGAHEGGHHETVGAAGSHP